MKHPLSRLDSPDPNDELILQALTTDRRNNVSDGTIINFEIDTVLKSIRSMYYVPSNMLARDGVPLTRDMPVFTEPYDLFSINKGGEVTAPCRVCDDEHPICCHPDDFNMDNHVCGKDSRCCL